MLCCRVQNLLSAYCDCELTGAEMLRIRAHLSACPACRQEYADLRQLKALMGALDRVEPERPFNPQWLDAALRASWSPRSLLERAGLLRRRARSAGSGRYRWGSGSFRPSGGYLALGGALALGTLAVTILHQPQKPDAVSAHVPEAIGSDSVPGLTAHEAAVFSGQGLNSTREYDPYSAASRHSVRPAFQAPFTAPLSITVVHSPLRGSQR
jgi:putative zinc finger protein